jgi:hypothetical protein
MKEETNNKKNGFSKREFIWIGIIIFSIVGNYYQFKNEKGPKTFDEEEYKRKIEFYLLQHSLILGSLMSIYTFYYELNTLLLYVSYLEKCCQLSVIGCGKRQFYGLNCNLPRH